MLRTGTLLRESDGGRAPERRAAVHRDEGFQRESFSRRRAPAGPSASVPHDDCRPGPTGFNDALLYQGCFEFCALISGGAFSDVHLYQGCF